MGDEEGGDVSECGVVVRIGSEADTEIAEAIVPAVDSFDAPAASRIGLLRGRCWCVEPALGRVHAVAPCLGHLPRIRNIEAFIAAQLRRLLGAGRYSSHHGAVQRGVRHLRIVAVGGVECFGPADVARGVVPLQLFGSAPVPRAMRKLLLRQACLARSPQIIHHPPNRRLRPEIVMTGHAILPHEENVASLMPGFRPGPK